MVLPDLDTNTIKFVEVGLARLLDNLTLACQGTICVVIVISMVRAWQIEIKEAADVQQFPGPTLTTLAP